MQTHISIRIEITHDSLERQHIRKVDGEIGSYSGFSLGEKAHP